jgi:hypothetical protein
MEKKSKKNNENLISLKYLIMFFQIAILLLSSVLTLGIIEFLMGLSVLAMSYNNQKLYGTTIMTWIYVLIGVLLLFLGIADLNGYSFL